MRDGTWRRRLLVGVRLFLLVAAGLAAIGIGGHVLGWPLLTSTLGPTGYVFAAHPDSETARIRNAVVGHAVAVAAGLSTLAVFGLLSYPSITAQGGRSTLAQVGAAAVAGGLTVLTLTVLRAHHAPAAATALLIATGLAKPGVPLEGLVIGLAGIIVLGPLLGRLPGGRAMTARENE